MANARDYIDYLDQEISISPANSEEEYQAAQTISRIMQARGANPQIQEFDTSAFGVLAHNIVIVLLFIGAMLAGLSGIVGTIGFLLVVAAMAVIILSYLGNDFLATIGPSARSQNVIGFHPAEGDKVTNASRRIVIVAHYDAPHENLLYSPNVARYQVLLKKYNAYFILATAVATLLQAILPGVVHIIFWIIAIVASIIPTGIAVANIASHFSGCTQGANDNKSSVAALLSIMSKVYPDASDDELLEESRRARAARDEERARREAEEAAMRAAEEMARAAELENENGAIRHGEEVVRGLGLLSDDCELIYEDCDPQVEDEEDVVGLEGATAELDMSQLSAMDDDDVEAQEVLIQKELPLDEAQAYEVEATEVVDETSEEDEDRTVAMPVLADGVYEEVDGGTIDGDTVGFDVIPSDSYDEKHQSSRRVKGSIAEPVDQPQWGQSEFEPSISNAARRASLFDLPDPFSTSVDPFENMTASNKPAEPEVVAEEVVEVPAEVEQPAVPKTVRLDQAAISPLKARRSRKNIEHAAHAGEEKSHRFFGRKKKEAESSMSDWLGVEDDFDAKKDGRSIGSWDNFNNDESNHWKGGASRRSDLRIVENPEDHNQENEGASEDALFDAAVFEDQQILNEANGADAVIDEAAIEHLKEVVPDDSELVDAVLSLNYEDLIAHDIWFVALGASELDHAGMDAFLAEYRRDIRGAFIINLDSIGAGQLTLLTEEGQNRPRRADRRITRLLTDIASDLHVHLEKAARPWMDTDATPAMRTSLRCVTLTGLDENGLPAFAHTPEDVLDNIDCDQIETVAQLITELIRRS